MALRNWYDYNPDPLPAGTRPLRWGQKVTRFKNPNTIIRWERLPSGESVPHYGSAKVENVQIPYVNPNEIVQQIEERFNAQPVTFRTDPTTGKVIATKSMSAPELPAELAGTRFGRYLGSGKNLSMNWILPSDALTGPKFLERRAPVSDAAAQLANQAGIQNVGNQRMTLNPQTYWPTSSFRVPTAGQTGTSGGGYTENTPVFGGTVDYNSGKYYYPPSSSGYNDTYGRFEPRFKSLTQIRPWRSSGITGLSVSSKTKKNTLRRWVPIGGGVSALRYIQGV